MHDWAPIGSSTSRYFSGRYDGGGYTITNMTLESGSYKGLFGCMKGGMLKNIVIAESDISFTGNYSYIGIVVGAVDQDSAVIVRNCINYSNINAENSNYIGGIVGGMYSPNNVFGADNLTIVNCINYGQVNGDSYVGGIIGYYYSRPTTEPTRNISMYGIEKCDNFGAISGNALVGGICGSFEIASNRFDGVEDIYFQYCSNNGTITGNGGNVGGLGGLVGYLGNVAQAILECYNTGNVINLSSTGVTGGLFGGVNTDEEIVRCYNTGDITNGNGMVGSCSSITFYDCYNRGDCNVGFCSDSSIIRCYNCYNVSSASYAFFDHSFTYTLYNCFFNSGSNDFGGGAEGGSGNVYKFNENEVSSYAVSWGPDGYIGTISCSIENVKDINWYLNSANWNKNYPWDFENVWAIDSNTNDGYPILQGFSVNITYNSNYGENEVITEQVPSGQEIVIAGYDLFTRVGYEIAHWNTKPDGTGLNFYAGDTYSEGAGLTLYAIWKAGIYAVTLGANGGSGGTQKIWVKYGYGFYANSSATGSPITSLTSLPTREGYTFNGFYTSATSGTRLIDSTGKIIASNTFTTADVILYAQWMANNPAKYDSEGGYWYIENGKMPQDKVTDSTLISNINSSITVGTTYYFAGLSLQSKVYGGKEYCQYNGNWYEVMPIRWRLVYSSSQTSGYGTTTDTLAVMAEIVYVDAFSDSYIGAGVGYSSESVTEFMKNQIDATYLVTETKSMPTFGTTSLNGTPTSVTENIFVASSEEISNFTTNANGTEKQGSIKFSDLAKDFLLENGKDTIYFTRDLGTNYNNIFCMNANGDSVQYKAQNYLGVQFTIKVTEYACV